MLIFFFFFFQAEDGIRDYKVTGVQTCALPILPPGIRAAFEFRHASWFDEEVFGALAARNLAVCIADSEKLSTPVRITADYAYFRLRDEGYQPDDIKRWADTIARDAAACRDVFVYFKHEESGKGPEFARLL